MTQNKRLSLPFRSFFLVIFIFSENSFLAIGNISKVGDILGAVKAVYNDHLRDEDYVLVIRRVVVMKKTCV